MIYFLGLIVPLFSYVFQIYPRLFNRYFGVDVWMRMIEADLIRKNHHRIPMHKISGGFIIEGYFYYPPTLSWMLSYIPKGVLLNIQGLIAPIFDIFQNIIIFIITLQLTKNITIALTAQIIYATIPIIILENSYLTPRSLGYLFLTMAFYPLLLYSTSPNPLYLILSIVCTILVFFTHKFATQSLFFLVIFFSTLEKNPLYIFVFTISFLSAIVLSKGYYLKILGEHIGFIYYWVKNYQNHYAYQIKNSTITKTSDFVKIVYFFLSRLSPISLLGLNLWTIGPLSILIAKSVNWSLLPYNNPFLFKMSLWALFFYVLSVLVLSIGFLRSIGEGQRYMEMATVPTSILTSVIFITLINSQFKIFAILIFISVLITNIALAIFLQQKIIIKDKNRSLTNDMQNIIKFINQLKYKPRILCLPQQIASMIVFNTKAKVLVDFQATTGQQIQDVYPVLKSSIKNIAKKYNLNILLLNNTYSTIKKLKLSKGSLLFESGNMQVIKI